MIVFCGEIVRENKGGSWNYEIHPSRKTELQPYFIDSYNKKYNFTINVLLARELLNDQKKFDIKRILRLLKVDWNKIKIG